MTLFKRLSTIKAVTQYLQKDLAKAVAATKFIGRGSDESSTHRYMIAAGDLANSGNYSETDHVFVSVEGGRRGRLPLDKVEVDCAIAAGVTFVADVAADRNRSYNVGERELMVHLQNSGYRESSPGQWSKRRSAN